jgi:hypothetical protein
LLFDSSENLPPVVLTTIRTYRNTDTAAICKVWNAHYGDLGAECRLTPLQIELATLAKPYFVADDLLVAEHDEQMVGFLHLSPVPNDDSSEVSTNEAAIAALCCVPCDGEGAVAEALLARAEAMLVERRIAVCRFKPLLPKCAFYQGFGPADSMIGATTSERRGCRWLTAAGFTPAQATTQWELDLSNYQPPIDRVQIQIRRSTRIERLPDEPMGPWWQACWLGHTEASQYELHHRSEQRLICDAMFWTVAIELQTSPDTIAWLWPASIPTGEQGAEHLTFLLGEVCRQLQSERLDLVRTATAASDTRFNGILRRLSFVAEQSGMVFEKRLAVREQRAPGS